LFDKIKEAKAALEPPASVDREYFDEYFDEDEELPF